VPRIRTHVVSAPTNISSNPNKNTNTRSFHVPFEQTRGPRIRMLSAIAEPSRSSLRLCRFDPHNLHGLRTLTATVTGQQQTTPSIGAIFFARPPAADCSGVLGNKIFPTLSHLPSPSQFFLPPPCLHIDPFRSRLIVAMPTPASFFFFLRGKIQFLPAIVVCFAGCIAFTSACLKALSVLL